MRSTGRLDITPPPQPLPLIEGPSAWSGEALRHSEAWIYRLSAGEVAEVEAAWARARERGLAIQEIGREDFPLPTLGPVLQRLLEDDLLEGRGFVLIKGLPVERYPVEQAATIYWGIGAHIGRAVSQNGKGHLLGHVRSLGYDLGDPRVRVYQTTARQTYHTDSCDVVGLLCLQTARRGGESSLVSSMTVYNEMVRTRPDLAAALFEPVATDRRGEVPEGQRPYFMVPVFNWYEGRLSVLYARRYIDSAQQNFPDAPRLTPQQVEALDLFDALAEDPRLHLDMHLERGDIQLVHNHTILHDRLAYEDWPEPGRKRHLLRLWLSPPVARPLPPVYAQRYGRIEIGNRGGIIVPGSRLNVPLEPV